MIPPDAQRSMAKRAGATVTEAKSSHEICVSQREVVEGHIAQASEGRAIMFCRMVNCHRRRCGRRNSTPAAIRRATPVTGCLF